MKTVILNILLIFTLIIGFLNGCDMIWDWLSNVLCLLIGVMFNFILIEWT